MGNKIELYTLFKDAFIASFKINRHEIRWGTPPRRTTTMLAHIFPTIGDYLNLAFEYEYGKERFDAIFYDINDNQAYHSNIKVLVEHKNNAHTISQELEKFRRYNKKIVSIFWQSDLPKLNVLITYTWEGNQQRSPRDIHEEFTVNRENIRSILRDIPGNVLFIFPKGQARITTAVHGEEIKWYFYVVVGDNLIELK